MRVKKYIRSFYPHDKMMFLALFEPDFAACINMFYVDYFVKCLDLDVIYIAAALGNQSPRFAAGCAQTGLREKLEGRYSLLYVPMRLGQ